MMQSNSFRDWFEAVANVQREVDELGLGRSISNLVRPNGKEQTYLNDLTRQ